MRTLGLGAAVLAMSLAGPAFAAMDEEKKPAGEQQGAQQQSTNKQQEAGQAATSSEAKNKAKDGSGSTQPTETPEATAQSGSTGTQSGSGSEGMAAGSGNTAPDNAGTGDTTTGKVTEGQDVGSDVNEQASLTAAQGKELIGKTLVGADDQQVGEINDVVVSDDGKLKSVLINVGGFLGIGDKTVAIPADTIEVQDDKVIARDLTKEAAENMSEYKAKGG